MNSQACELLALSLEHLLTNERDVEDANMAAGNSGKLADSPFACKSPINEPVTNYLRQIQKYANCSDSSYILAYIYIHRLLSLPSFTLSKNTIHKVVLSAIIVAIKYNEDSYVDNEDYASVGGITLEELNAAEIELLTLLEFKAAVSYETYTEYCRHIKQLLVIVQEHSI
eukprot:TRINITY_DN1224_c0_g3_i3.p1 TRINITY_DN1224_c0_g3~~TRINITY_DN1224_c0_g3_i3.p1  ORF type:complete len:170 (-),score=33.99 TRINITY_DN1224_c0_g3_i3:137-646(-)